MPIDILVAEDSEDDIILLQEAFAWGELVNIVHIARDGEEALQYLKGEPPHEGEKLPGLIMLDINMPKKTGIEVLMELKQNPSLKHIPVVIMTVSDRDEDMVRAYAEGACSFIRKPLDFLEFQKVMKKFSLYWALVVKIPKSG